MKSLVFVDITVLTFTGTVPRLWQRAGKNAEMDCAVLCDRQSNL